MRWWKKIVITFGLFAAWFCGLIAFGERDYGSQYFWVSGCAMAIGFAVAPLWRFRSTGWYWPTVVSLGIAHLAALYSQPDFTSNPDLPAKGVVQGLFVLDCLASWAVMVAVCYFFVRKFPWQVPSE